MRLGFIGTGTITRAVVTGLIHVGAPFEHICLSPRNADVGIALAALDPRISVCGTNQQVLDASDVVCLAVVPTIAPEVLGALEFEARHHVVSFIAGVSLAALQRMVGAADAIVRAVPLPAVAAGMGSTAICPPDEITRRLFSWLGTPVEVSDERKFDALSAVTATMASFYAVLDTQAEWLVQQGIDHDSARAYLGGYCRGLAHETSESGASFSALVAASMTPGGINEQLHNELSVKGTYSHYREALDHVLRRVEGR
ncbi:pyrroline-5-carboxylate reductase [Paraburkholderia sp. BL21I4N1]|uniref:pyrroline-5-carboxylate reductase n=1 Tax=Paraburkholderia sp. BL21I4N1 TaxID=1938801 RepID=UPI000CFC82A2|nr:pyrroline-5-carboxylate reductase [Paraburkholderia sp. BL21I4N1]PQV54889.1 pyrroline-5-carboxylate reductase [Paraburkholderia sp. BL21I4N1]